MDELRATYEGDFYAWTQEQAAALRREAERRSNAALDYENLAEEIESLGRSDRRAVVSHLARIIEHLLKLEHSPDAEPRRQWRNSVQAHRGTLRRLLKESPSLAARADELVREAYDEARTVAATALILGADELPDDCPFPAAALQAADFWPVNRHGIDDTTARHRPAQKETRDG